MPRRPARMFDVGFVEPCLQLISDEALRAEGHAGGVADKLETFIRRGALQGVCFGSFNEAGSNMHDLLRTAAREHAHAWMQAGAQSYGAYLSYLTVALYRRWGAAFARANTRMRVLRLGLMGVRGRAADGVGRRDEAGWEGVGGAGLFVEGIRPLT